MRTLVGLLLALVLAVPAAAQTGRVSAGNSTTAVLGSGATFTGAWDDATQAAVVVVTIKADQASATNGVKVEFSSDCVNQDYVTTHSFTDTVNGMTFADAMAAKCVRIEFVNGASGQASFRLQTVVRDNGYGGTSAGGGVAGSVTINDPTITTQKAAVNASGQLSITCANCSGSGASAVDEAPFTQGTNSVAPAGILFKTNYTALASGQAGILRGFSDGSLFAMGNVASGAADTGNPLKFGVVFNTTQPTVTTGQRVDAQGTARGELLIAKGVSGFSIDNASFGISGTLPAFASTPSFTISGTLPAFASTPAVTISGTLPAYASTPAFTISGTLPAFAATPTVNLGTLNGAALDASVTGLEVAQASTTSGQKGVVVQGAVTTNAPTYTTAQTDPLSLDTAGLLRMSLKDTPSNTNNFNVNLAASGATVTVAGTITANEGGTWTVQPGNTANTTPWLMSIVGGGNTASVNASNQLAVNCANCSGSGVSQQDNTGFTTGSGNFVPTGGIVNNGQSYSTVPAGNSGAAYMTSTRAVWENLRDNNGTEVPLASLLGQLLVALQRQTLSPPTAYATRTALVGTLGEPLGTLRAPLAVAPINTSGCAGSQPSQTLSAPINTAAIATTKIISANGAVTPTYVCAVDVVVAAADNLALVYGIGTNCGTGTTGLAGGSTAATGWNMAANGGLAKGTGQGVLWKIPAGNDVCVVTSAAVQASGSLTYTQAIP